MSRAGTALGRVIAKGIADGVKQKNFSKEEDKLSAMQSARIKSLFQEAKQVSVSTRKMEISPGVKGGYEFQEQVSILLTKLDFSKVKTGSKGPDGGVDITAEQKTKLGTSIRFVIECKHQPNSSIGRPVVQKLDSAVRSNRFDKGMIITSGRFSRDAVDYAKQVGIELIDGSKLNKLFEETGVRLENEATPSESLSISDWKEVESALHKYFETRKISIKPKLEPEKIQFEPVYFGSAYIDQTFSTSTGTIYSINERTQLLTRMNGEIVNDEETRQIIKGIENPSNNNKTSIHIENPDERLSEEKLTLLFKEYFQYLYTKNIPYYGGNGVRYQKMCTPSFQNINMENVAEILIPKWIVKAELAGKNYVLRVRDTAENFYVEEDSSTKCAVCNEDALEEPSICTKCNRITCNYHSKECKICQKTLCTECVKIKTKWLVFDSKFCDDCFKKETK